MTAKCTCCLEEIKPPPLWDGFSNIFCDEMCEAIYWEYAIAEGREDV